MHRASIISIITFWVALAEPEHAWMGTQPALSIKHGHEVI